MEGIQAEEGAQQNAQRNERLWHWEIKRTLRLFLFTGVFLRKSYRHSEENTQFLLLQNGRRSLEVRRKGEQREY